MISLFLKHPRRVRVQTSAYIRDYRPPRIVGWRDRGQTSAGEGKVQRKGWDLRAGTINTCHASHTYMRTHLSFHTRADRGAHIRAITYVGNVNARARKGRQSIYLKATRRQSPCRTIKDGGGNVTFPYTFLGGSNALGPIV